MIGVLCWWTVAKTKHIALTILMLALVLPVVVAGQGVPPRGDKGSKLPPPSMSTGTTADFPYIDYGIHKTGHLWNTIMNNGIVGNMFRFEDPERGQQAPSFYHPLYSRIQHGYYSALWIGGVKRGDTLVSVAFDADWDWWDRGYPMEFWPDVYPFGQMSRSSTNPNSPDYVPWANGEVEYLAMYTDTTEYASYIPYNPFDMRGHLPLGLQVRQTSYSWSYRYAQDFIIIDYNIANISPDTIYDAWFGQYYVGCVHHRGEMPYPPSDDIAGYLDSAQHEFEELGKEAVDIAYCIDRDGLSFGYGWDFIRTSSAFGIAPLRLPPGALGKNFNWWNDQYGSRYNWGPRRHPTDGTLLRIYSGGLGVPRSDRDKYHLMSKPEIDYCGYEARVDHTSEGWLPPFEYGGNLARGHLPEFVMSYGAFDIPPGESRNVTIVMSIGEDIHYDPTAFRDLFDTLNPYPFMEQLDFSDLIENVRWAKIVFDNPGVDTDGDGDSGRFFWRVEPLTGDSTKIYYAGDGEPDFRGAAPPPPPEVRVSSEDGRIIVRWNGRNTELFFDPLSYCRDFEGYRVYRSRSRRLEEAVLVASFDNENYFRHRWDYRRKRFTMTELPFTLDSLRTLYGDDFQPLDYIYSEPLYIDSNVYYFTSCDYNVSDLLDPSGIHKLYPDATMDTTDVDEEGRMRYYEYEYIIEDLLPTVPYYVSVTAFDFGHPAKSLDPMESSLAANMTEVFAVDQGPDILREGKLNVYCYPNPYRIDADYDEAGFENHGLDLPPERARSIYFANLPNKCTISIFTLDGDLVRRLEHDEPPGSGLSSVHHWNVISRNTQAVVTGLYYWVVESAYGNQVGKLVIIK